MTKTARHGVIIPPEEFHDWQTKRSSRPARISKGAATLAVVSVFVGSFAGSLYYPSSSLAAEARPLIVDLGEAAHQLANHSTAFSAEYARRVSATLAHIHIASDIEFSPRLQLAAAAEIADSFTSYVGALWRQLFGAFSQIVATPEYVRTPGVTELVVGSSTTTPTRTVDTTTVAPIQQTIINQQPVIERIIVQERSGLSQSSLTLQLASLKDELLSRIASINLLTPSLPTATFQAFAASQRIDQLTGTSLTNVTVSGVSGLTDSDIPDGITAANYLPLIGGTLTGNLTLSGVLSAGSLLVSTISSGGAIEAPYFTATSTTASSTFPNLLSTNATTTNATSTSLFSTLGRFTNGIFDTLLTAASASITNLTATTLTATNATTTRLDALEYVAVGGSATTTIRGDGVASILPYASSTALTVSGTASTTNLVVSSAGGAAGCATFSTSGLISNTGTACGSGSGIFSWTPTTNFGAAANSTSTPIWFTVGLQASSTSRLANVALDASGYLTFGATSGTSGYGFRDNVGTLEFKNSGGSWNSVNTATSTFPNLNATNSTTTNATSTNQYATALVAGNATSTNFFSTLGRFTTGIFDTLLTAASASITNLTATTLSATNATTTRLDALEYVAVGGSATTTIRGDGVASILPYASSTALTVSGTASTSNLIASTGFTFKTVTGFLKASAGIVSEALVDLASNVTGILPVANGGTGWAAIQSGTVPYGNGSGALSTTTAGTNGQVLALLSGVPTWVATTTLATISGVLNGAQLDGVFGSNGILARTTTGTYASRTLTGTAGQITVANGDGVAGNPTLSLPSQLFLTNASTSALSANTAAFGQTGTTSISSTGALTIQSLTGFLKASAGIVSEALVDLAANVTGILPAANGGTGLTTFGGTNHVLYTSGTDALTSEAAFTYDGSENRLTFDYASTTALTISGTASTTNLVVSSAGGAAGCATFSTSGLISNTGTACGSGSGTFSWTPTTNFGATANSTSTPIWFAAGIQASSTSRLANVALDASGYLNFGTATGTGGYGIRDNGGTMEYKNSGGTWTAFPSSDNVTVLSAIQTYTSNTTWSKPADLEYAVVEVWGGGGGGSGADGSSGSNVYAGGGGGGGAYAQEHLTAAELGSSESVIVGTGGSAGSVSGTAGGAGGSSSFGSHTSVNGGGGATGAVSGIGGAGGAAGSSGDINLGGEKGGNGLAATTGTTGAGGSSPRGGRGTGSHGTGFADRTGDNGNAPGGGGEGGLDNDTTGSAGGAGGAGMVVVYEYIATSTSGADLAENYPVDDPTLEAGDIVAFDNGMPITVMRASKLDERPLAGIISTKPGLLLGTHDVGHRPVALSGRVPTKVNLEGGPIAIGDRIALSSVPGVGKKALQFEDSVGIAISNYEETEDGEGTVTVFIDLQQGIDIEAIGLALLEPSTSTASSSNSFNFIDSVLTALTNKLGLFAEQTPAVVSSSTAASTATSTATSTEEITEQQPETIWSRLLTLAQNFVDGVLTLTGMRSDYVEAREGRYSELLCLGETCISEAELKGLLDGKAQPSAQPDEDSSSEDTYPGLNAEQGSASDDDGEVADSGNDDEAADDTDFEAQPSAQPDEDSSSEDTYPDPDAEQGSASDDDGEVADAGTNDEAADDTDFDLADSATSIEDAGSVDAFENDASVAPPPLQEVATPS